MSAEVRGKARYGWDAPGIMLGMLAIGAALVTTGCLAIGMAPFVHAPVIGWVLLIPGLVPLLLGLMMLQYGLAGKLRTRDAMLNLVAWRGDEVVLDVGTGAGMLLIGAAARLDRGGWAIGIDIWSAKDLSNNAAATTARNIAMTGVVDRTEVVTADATRLPFSDHSFDVVLSLLCLHNIEPKPDQGRACREIARVLKPSGRVVIGDYVPTHGYAAALRQAGLVVRQSRNAIGMAGSLMWLLVADMPVPA